MTEGNKDKKINDIGDMLRDNQAVIKVFGAGGAGVNAVNNMIESGLQGVEFYAANTCLLYTSPSPRDS